MVNVNALRAERSEVKAQAKTLIDAAIKSGKDLSGTALTAYNNHLARLDAIDESLDNHASGAHFADAPTAATISARADGVRFSGIGAFINTGEGGIQASLSEGGSLMYAVPSYQVDRFLAAYPAVDPFGAAGATVLDTEDGHEVRVPIITAGSDAATFAEEHGPTVVQDAGVYVAKLGAEKYSFLTKLSEEAAQDIPSLDSTLAAEGVRRVMNSISKATTTATIAALTTANAIVAPGTDWLTSLLNLESSIDPTWAGQDNCFMLSRTTLSSIRNVRDLQDRPIFDPTAKTLLGYKAVLNDACTTRVIFGAWRPGLYLRRTRISVQRLIELYSEQGQIGVKFVQRADSVAFAEAANASQAPQPLVMLGTGI